MGPALSLCLVVKNEEQQLSRCLDSARKLATEIIIVDTGSTDATLRIAEQYGAKISSFDFTTVDFAAARNYAITQAQTAWILMLDADETLAPETAPMIQTLVARNESAGFYLERHNPSIDHVVRLFPRKPSFRYRGRVHETIDDSILATGTRLFKTPIRIYHNFSTDAEARRRKNHLYIRILEEELAANPADDSRLDFLAAEYHQLGMFQQATEIAERLAVIRPLDARAHLFAGTYHFLYQPDFARARADFNQALELQPGYPEAEAFLRALNDKESLLRN